MMPESAELLGMGLAILIAGLVGWHTRGVEIRGEFPDIDRRSPDLRRFEARFLLRAKR